jgi:hypothetical protein
MRTCWFVVIESGDAWWVDCEGRTYGPFRDRELATEAARSLAETFGDETRRCDVYAPNDSGKQELVWSRPPRR